MNAKQRGVIIVLGNRPDDPEYFRRIERRGDVVYIESPTRATWSGERPPLAILGIDYVKSFDIMRNAVGELCAGRKISGIVSQRESGLVPGQRLRRHFLPETADDLAATEALRDKVRMRELLASSRADTVPHAIGTSQHDIEEFFEHHGRLIVKPRDGVASHAVFAVPEYRDAALAYRALSDLHIRSFIIEAYLEGPEYSVESFSVEGTHHIVAVTEKRLFNNHVEMAHILPANITARDKGSVCEATVRLLHAVGMKNGAAHTEIRLTALGPRIIESQNRIGGDFIGLLINLVYGVDLFDLMLAEALREPIKIPPASTPRCSAAICYAAPQRGTLRNFRGLEKARAVPGVILCDLNIGVGARLSHYPSSNNRPAFAIATATTPQSALETAQFAVSLIEIETLESPRGQS